MDRQDLPRPLNTAKACGLPLLSIGLSFAISSCAANANGGVTIDPVVIPVSDGMAGGNAEAIEAYYRTVFERMRDALHGGTQDSLGELRYLLQIHRKEGMVEFARQQMDGYALLADGLEFELDLARLSSLQLRTESPTAHAEQQYSFVIRAYRDGRVLELGGSDEDAVGFQVRVKLRDFDVAGRHLDTDHNLTLRVVRPREIVGNKRLELPFSLPGANPTTVIREVWLGVEILPGRVRVDGRDLPVSISSRVRSPRGTVEELPEAERLSAAEGGYSTCCEYRRVLYPAGVESIRRAPLTTLMAAMRRGTPQYFRHVYLAAHFLAGQDRERAMSRLIEWVRIGTREQAQVAMGALRTLAATNPQDPVRQPVTDRQAWLRWWKQRNAKPK